MRNAFLRYLISEVTVIFVVTLIFKVIPERQIAASIAGFLFLALPIGMILVEYQRAGLKHFYWYISVLQFLTVFAIPIFFLRIFNYGVPFEQLSFLGIAGPVLHKWSSKSYMVMMAFTAWNWWRLSKEERLKSR